MFKTNFLCAYSILEQSKSLTCSFPIALSLMNTSKSNELFWLMYTSLLEVFIRWKALSDTGVARTMLALFIHQKPPWVLGDLKQYIDHFYLLALNELDQMDSKGIWLFRMWNK